MNIEKFLLRSEDEMDFLPIIPLNESDQEDLNGVEIPAEIALLPLRNTVWFCRLQWAGIRVLRLLMMLIKVTN